MAAIPYMPLYIADYLADAAHLSTLEHGAYLLLIMNYWQRGKPLPSSNERLANVARMSNEEFAKIRNTLAEFFTVTDTEWVHKRIEEELVMVRSKTKQARNAGLASAQRRLNRRSTNAERTFNHTDTDTDTDKEEDKKEKINNKEKVEPVATPPPKTMSGQLPDDSVLAENKSLGGNRLEQNLKSKSKPNKLSATFKLEVQEIFLHWQQVMNHPGALLDEKRQKKITQALQLGFDIEKLKQAIEGCKQSKFHMGENEHNTVYDELNVIFRDAAQIEKFMALAIKSNQPKPEIPSHFFDLSPNAKRIVDQYEAEALRCKPPT